MHLVSLTIAALVLMHSSQALVLLEFSYSRVWLHDNVHVDCVSHNNEVLNNVQWLRFWSTKPDRQAEFIAENPKCDYTIGKLEVTKNSFEGRMSLDTSAVPNATRLSWKNLTIEDSDSYKCELTLCSTKMKEETVKAVDLTVVIQPTKPEIKSPPSIVHVPADLEVSFIFECIAYAGFPDGTTTVSFSPSDGNEVFQDITQNSTGYYSGSWNYTHTFPKGTSAQFFCRVHNNAGIYTIEDYDTVTVEVEYRPTNFEIVSNQQEFPVSNTSPGQYVMNTKAPVNVDIICATNGSPAPEVILYKLSAPEKTVETISNTRVRIHVSESQMDGLSQLEIILQCDSKYTPTLEEIQPRTDTAILKITVMNDGASLVQLSIAAYFATLIVVLKVF